MFSIWEEQKNFLSIVFVLCIEEEEECKRANNTRLEKKGVSTKGS
jgi:hypothetical protein